MNFTRLLNQTKAWQKGKRVMLTVENPDSTQTNARMIRVPASEYWGDFRVKQSASESTK